LAGNPRRASPAPAPLRWRLAGEEDAGALFSTEDIVERHVGTGEYRSMEFLHVNARRVVNRVPASSRMPFRYTINAYRGCSHSCSYCFARPTHEYLGLGLGEDFERKIVVKVNAVERVEAEVRSPRWEGAHIAMGTNTDPYQKAEAKYHLTRGIVEVLGRAGNPFSILTKSTLVLRDLDVLKAAARQTDVRLALSIGTLDREVWRATEPGTPPPDKRVEAVRKLNDAGIPCSVLMAPILPGLSDSDEQLEAVAAACAEAGATSITPIALHLRAGVKEHYMSWLASARPDLVALHEKRFGRRSYQPEADQQRIRDVVDRALAGSRRRGDTARPGPTGNPGDTGNHGDEDRRHGETAPTWRRGDFATGHEEAADHDAALRSSRHERPRIGPDQMRLF
jgi:DNA repair photolyase